MACQKVCKQGRDDITVKVNLQKPHPCIFFHYSCSLVWKRYRDGALYIYLHFYIIPTLFAYFLACHLYIFLHF